MPASEFQIERREPTNAAVVRRSARASEVSAALGESFGVVFGTLAQQNVAPISMPFARYLGMGEQVEFEAGALVAAPFAPAGDVRGIQLPGGEVASAIHTGPYDTLPEANAALAAWVKSQGREPAGAPWEEYIDDPGEKPDPATWRTRVNLPLK